MSKIKETLAAFTRAYFSSQACFFTLTATLLFFAVCDSLLRIAQLYISYYRCGF